MAGDSSRVLGKGGDARETQRRGRLGTVGGHSLRVRQSAENDKVA